MARKISMLAPEWWDYTTLDDEILNDAAKLTAEDMAGLSREGFKVVFYDTLEDFYLAEALEYIAAWKQATADNPAGLCGHPLSFAKADMELCFNRIDDKLRIPESNIHFPKADASEYIKRWDGVRCVVMQGGQGDIKHWAFNDPMKRQGDYKDQPPTPKEYGRLTTRVVDLHPVTVMQNARTSGGGVVTGVPTRAITVGPIQTWQAEKVSIWQAGTHDNPFGMRLTALMIGKKIADSSVPMSLLAGHPNVQFNFYRPAIGKCEAEMH